jgi:hypothetical protein
MRSESFEGDESDLILFSGELVQEKRNRKNSAGKINFIGVISIKRLGLKPTLFWFIHPDMNVGVIGIYFSDGITLVGVYQG